MTLSPACGGSSPEGGASYLSLSLRERWHAVGVTERVFRGEQTPHKPQFTSQKTFINPIFEI